MLTFPTPVPVAGYEGAGLAARSERWRFAGRSAASVHEAGHAMIAHSLGLPIASAAVTPPTTGHVHADPSGSPLVERVALWLGGPVCELEFHPAPQQLWLFGDTDWDVIRGELSACHPSRRQAAFDAALALAQRLLRGQDYPLSRLAAELDRKFVLSGGRVAAVLSTPRPPAPVPAAPKPAAAGHTRTRALRGVQYMVPTPFGGW